MPTRWEDDAGGCGMWEILITCTIGTFLLLVAAYAFLFTVRVTMSDASLARFALLNSTALAYDLSLSVAVHNPNWFMDAKHAEVRLRVVAGETAESAAEVLGSDGVAELVKETVAGQLESLELKLSGEIKYNRPVFRKRYRLDVTCPLSLPTVTAVVPGRTVVVSDKVIKCH